ncbi:PAS domain S-box protein [Leptolyngbya sp. FACHB-17]|uniref:PAS domain S-box protein n=1 Tax=unclassified Leptolyngbya TaxID=2650499 RepID=UPI001680F4B0|nr:PAS domain S-box protein [Leptolyngbya sp. FACHB-17]
MQLRSLIHNFNQERDFVAAILDTIAALVIMLDRQGRIVCFNKACEQITKYPFVAVENKFFWDILSLPTEIELTQSEFNQLTPEQLPKNYERKLLTRDGKQLLVAWTVTAVTNETGQIIYVICTGQDITESRKAEIALQHSEERFRMMVEGSEQVFFYSHDKNHIFEYISPSAQTVLGYAPEELVGKECEFFLIDDDEKAQAIELTDKTLLSGERNKPFVVISRHKNGDLLFTEVVETPIKVDGNVVGMQGFIRDITKRKIAEIELCQQRDFNTTIVQTSPAFFVAINPDGTVKMMNQAMLNALDYTLEEVIGTNYLTNFVPTEQRDILGEVFRSATAQELLPSQENHVLTKNGTKLLVDWHGRAVFQENGELNFFFGFGLDITERREGEIKLRSAAQRERLISDIALRVLKSLNLEEIISTTVAEVHQILQADRVFISNFCDSLHDHLFAESVSSGYKVMSDLFLNNSRLVQEMKALLCQGNFQKIDDINQTQISSGQADYFAKYQVKACLAVPIMVSNDFFGALVVHQCSKTRHWQTAEIELLQQLATQVAIAIQKAQLFQQIQSLNLTLEGKVQERTAQLHQRMLELQDLYKRQDEFLHAVSHDLRTPITGTLMLLKHWHQPSVEHISLSRDILDRMIESGERQMRLINSLLETHASEIKGISLQCEPMKVSILVQAIIEDLESLFIKNKASVYNLFSDDLPLVNGACLQLRRVFENLIINALNHNPPSLEITLQACLEGDFIRCLVQDNGVGMNEEQCLEVFERYSRGDRSRSTGIGLGLYLCRQIITAHGGQIGVHSSPGKGATFWFTLPIV